VTPSAEPSAHRRVVLVLAITQTVGYGVLLYAFPVLLLPVAGSLGISPVVTAGAATASLVAAALAAVPVGRWLDRHGGRGLMTAGSVLGVAALVAWSASTSAWQLYVALGLVGLALAASTYEAAFAVLVAVIGDPASRRRAMLTVTLVAGFASSIFFPLTGVLTDRLGWRAALLCLAGLLAVTAVPGHALAVPNGRSPRTGGRGTGAGVAEAVRDPGFLLATVAFLAHGVAVSAVSTLLVSHLVTAGLAATVAATVSGLLGVLSVAGRVLFTGVSARLGVTAVTAAIFAVQGVGALALPHAGSLTGVVVCVVAFGAGFGVATIARPAILLERYGTVRFATIAAAMSAPAALARAGAPVGAAALGDPEFLSWAGGACLLAACLLAALPRAAAGVSGRPPPRTPGSDPQATASTPSSSSSVRTRRSISSRMGRTASMP
jgi:predicted MFS family arabinose efflux permease